MDDTEPTPRTGEPAHPSPPSANELFSMGATRTEDDWDAEDSLLSWKLIAVIAAVLLVVGFGAYKIFGGSKTDVTAGPNAGTGVQIADAFGGSSTDGLGTTETGQTWEPVAGTWAKADGHAYIKTPVEAPEQRNMILVDLQSGNGSVSATVVKMVPNWGLVFRYKGPQNYWVLTAAPKFGGYNLTKVVDGKATNVASSGLAKVADGTTAGVEFQGGSISIVIDGARVKTITDGANQTATKVGLAADSAGKQAQWGSFRAGPAAGAVGGGQASTTAVPKPKAGPAPTPSTTAVP